MNEVQKNAFIAKFFFNKLFAPIFENPGLGASIDDLIISETTKHNATIINLVLKKLVSGRLFRTDIDSDSDYTPLNWFFLDKMPEVFKFFESITKVTLPNFIEKLINNELPKNFELDLVILNEEKEKYDSYVKEGILNTILNKGLSHMLNIRGGIYVLNNIKEDDINLISIYSTILIDAKNGNLNLILKDIEDSIVKPNFSDLKETKEIIEEGKKENQIVKNDLLYYNDYGGFSSNGKEYLIRVNKDEIVPMPWSHIIANKNFGSLLTESMSGYTWHQNCRLNRMTAWSNNPIQDTPSEVIYLKDDETKRAWSLGLNPMPDNNDYYITYGFGYGKYQHEALRY